MIPLAGLSQKEIEELISPLPRFRADQIFKWILKGVCGFDQMSNIPVSMQNELASRFCIFSGTVTQSHVADNTRKIVILLKDGIKTEAVLLSDNKKRFTACLSTQAGCPAGCVFCKTGSIGFKRNLDSSEITEQFFHLQNEIVKNNKGHIIDNIVVMGMGEPLLNLSNLRKAIAFFTDPAGMNFSKRRITISTCGIYEGLVDIAKNGPFIRLALSLVTADEDLRALLMPVSKSNPLIKIKEAILLYQRNSGGRITLEVPLLGGINTRSADAKSIADFAKGIETVINIIPWNPVSGLEFKGKPLIEPEKKESEDFIQMLKNHKLKVTVRMHKGQGIMGACGQLGAEDQPG